MESNFPDPTRDWDHFCQWIDDEANRRLDDSELQDYRRLVKATNDSMPLRSRCDLVSFIGCDVLLEEHPLDKSRMIGQCPFGEGFHDFQVHRERQSWKCDVCKSGGDVFSYVMARDRIEFTEAVGVVKTFVGLQ